MLMFFPDVDVFSIRTAEDHQNDFGPLFRSLLERRCLDWSDLPRESDVGCVEYKVRLNNEHHDAFRVQRLTTQMKFRLCEGGGTAYYLLGVSDSGFATGLGPRDHATAAEVLMNVAAIGGATLFLEAMSDRGRGGRRCSAWRVESRETALKHVPDHLCLSDSAVLSSRFALGCDGEKKSSSCSPSKPRPEPLPRVSCFPSRPRPEPLSRCRSCTTASEGFSENVQIRVH